ncbi:MAG: hypothetical protein AAFQ82_08915, partial [Myxococcota bacterium]
ELAGLPSAVVERAKEVLQNLETGEYDERGVPALAFSRKEAKQRAQGQLALFDAPRGPSEVERAVSALDPDAMSPREALDALYALKGKL